MSRLIQFCTILCMMQRIVSVSKREKLPNILILLADDVGMGDLGCFGNTTLPTPNIDSLAKGGVKLTQHLATSAVCTPSRSSFMTARYAVRLGMVPINMFRVSMFVSATGGLHPNEITFAELTKYKNYSTAFIGKWHLGWHGDKPDFAKSPMNQGFDYFYGVPLTNLKDMGITGETVLLAANIYIEPVLLAICFASYCLFWYLHKRKGWGVICSCLLPLPAILGALSFWVLWSNLPLLSGMVYRNYDVVEQPMQLETLTHRLVAEGKQFLEQKARDHRPFLLFMSWVQVHTALHASKRFRGKSAHGAYGDEIMELDWTIGEILNAIDEHGFSDNTIVYFSSDQGGHTEERGLKGRVEGGYNGVFRGGKAMGGWEGGIRVPTIMRWPGVIPSGSTVDVSTSQMDLMPTLAAALNVTMPTDRAIDGVNLLPLLTQEQPQLIPHEFMFHYCGNSMHAARWTPTDGSGDVWKVHFITPNWLPGTERCHYVCQCFGSSVTVQDPPLMFNMATDPGERKPCSDASPCSSKRSYAQVLSVIERAATEFSQSLDKVESQYAWYNFVPRPWLQPCCNFPYCSCKEEL